MEKFKKDKTARILGIYTKLMNGYGVKKEEEAEFYGVDKRSIQRDISDIRHYLANETAGAGFKNSIEYDCIEKVYRLNQSGDSMLSVNEVLAVCKILLDSRAFTKEEMGRILDKLISHCLPKSAQKQVTDLIGNEKLHYVELQHNKRRSKVLDTPKSEGDCERYEEEKEVFTQDDKSSFIDNIGDIGQAILKQRYIKIKYVRIKDKKEVERILRPLAIMFSEYYFYLAAFIDDEDVRERFEVEDDKYPTIYRIDRITDMKVLKQNFSIAYTDRFQDGE